VRKRDSASAGAAGGQGGMDFAAGKHILKKIVLQVLG